MKRVLILLALLLPFISNAHPGHGGSDGFTIIHYFTEPQHVTFILLSMAVVIFFLGRNKEVKEVEKQKQS